MLPVLEGVIRRRILLNFRIEPELLRPLIPAPLQLAEQRGHAIAGVCLIGLEQLRPKGFPKALSISSENMAHRVAIRYPVAGGWQDGVYVLRRDTDQRFISTFGGKLFPGVQGHATFSIQEDERGVQFLSETAGHEADVAVDVSFKEEWTPTPAFANYAEVSEFFRKGSCGFSQGSNGCLEAMELRTLDWQMTPLEIHSWKASFYESRWPLELDGALIMRQVPHEWHAQSA